MQITFYKNISERNKISKDITSVKSSDVVIKGDISIISPFFELQYDANITECNYCYIEEWDRYYFIDDITMTTGSRMMINCSIDVLMSYKDDILKQDVIILKQENIGNPYYEIGSYRTDSRSFDTVYKFNGGEFSEVPTHVLICAGG